MALPQPVPPSWKDLGKSASDLLGKDFPISGTTLEIKTKTPSNVTFKVAGSSHANHINGDIEAKYVDPKNALTVTQTWTTSNILKNSVELDNALTKGLKFQLDTSLHPDKDLSGSKNKNALLSTVYKQPGLHSRAFLDLFKGPSFTADAVLGRDGFLVGGEATYNVTAGTISGFATALGYSAPEYAVSLHGLHNLNTVRASYYHRVNRDVEAGAHATYDNAKGGAVGLEVGAKVYLDAAAFAKAKVNSTGVVVLGYTQALRPGVKMSAGLALDTKKLNDPTIAGPAHKIGASFVFEG